MIKLQFTTNIKAARNIVWNVLWSNDTYPKWTSAFSEGSYAESDWNEGSEIKFLGPGGSAGIYAIIETKQEPSVMVFNHQGEIKDGAKLASSEWAGAKESYKLEESKGGTQLFVEMDSTEEFQDYFKKAWPEALEKIKALAEAPEAKQITIEATVNAPLEKVWNYWNDKDHVVKWNTASPDWHTPKAENDLRVGGTFSYRMEAKDGSFGFDFGGTYDVVKANEQLAYTLGDGRKVTIDFTNKDGHTHICESFEAETQNSMDLQRLGWQSILNNFKMYTEKN